MSETVDFSNSKTVFRAKNMFNINIFYCQAFLQLTYSKVFIINKAFRIQSKLCDYSLF